MTRVAQQSFFEFFESRCQVEEGFDVLECQFRKGSTFPSPSLIRCGFDRAWAEAILNNYPPLHLAADHSNMNESSQDQATQIDLAKTADPRIKGKIKDIILNH